MPVVISLIIVIVLVFLGWTWNNLGNIEKTKKIITIIISIIILGTITYTIFNISKKGMAYHSEEQMEVVRNVLVILFTFINGLCVMPSIAKICGKIYDNKIEQENAKKKFLIILIIFVIIMVIECGYMKSIQNDILKIYNDAIQAK